MHYIRLSIVCFFVLIGQLSAQIDSNLAAQLQQIVDNSLLTPGLKGVSACVISPNGEVWTGVNGEDAQGNWVTDTTLFYGGSTTKTFVAARIMQLRDAGLLDLNAPYVQYIPAIQNADTSATLYQFLTHTSGVFNVTDHPNMLPDAFVLNTTAVVNADSVFRRYLDRPHDFAPGTAFKYCNTGYIILGKIIEAVTGDSLHVDFRTHLYGTEPLLRTGMGYYDAYSGPRAGIWLAQGPNNTPPLVNYSNSSHNAILTGAGAAGAIVCNPHDLALWVRGLISGKYNSSATLQELLTPHPLSNQSYGPGIVKWVRSGKTMYGHTGGIGAVTYMFHLPAENISIVTMSNTSIDQGEVFIQIFNVLRTYSFTADADKIAAEQDLKVFPNPFQQEFVISGNAIDTDCEFYLSDMQGRQYAMQAEVMYSGDVRIHTEVNIAPGMYILKVRKSGILDKCIRLHKQ